MLPAVPWVNFRPGPPRAVGAPISPVNPLAPPPAAAVLSVEKGSPADARPHRPRQDTAPAHLPVADKRVELRPGPRVARAVSRRRDLDHDAGIGRAIGSLGELDVPIAVVFEPVDPPHPRGYAVGLELVVRAGSTAAARPEAWGRARGADRRRRCQLRRRVRGRPVPRSQPAGGRVPAALR